LIAMGLDVPPTAPYPTKTMVPPPSSTPKLAPVTLHVFPGYQLAGGSQGQPLATSSSIQSCLGPQVKSQRPSTQGYSFNRSGTGRERHAKAYDGVVVDPVYRGEEWNRHTIPGTPIPGTYEQAVSLGKQALSQRKLAPSFAFPKSGRFAHQDRAHKARLTPGPGEYVN